MTDRARLRDAIKAVELYSPALAVRLRSEVRILEREIADLREKVGEQQMRLDDQARLLSALQRTEG